MHRSRDGCSSGSRLDSPHCARSATEDVLRLWASAALFDLEGDMREDVRAVDPWFLPRAALISGVLRLPGNGSPTRSALGHPACPTGDTIAGSPPRVSSRRRRSSCGAWTTRQQGLDVRAAQNKHAPRTPGAVLPGGNRTAAQPARQTRSPTQRVRRQSRLLSVSPACRGGLRPETSDLWARWGGWPQSTSS